MGSKNKKRAKSNKFFRKVECWNCNSRNFREFVPTTPKTGRSFIDLNFNFIFLFFLLLLLEEIRKNE